jgi:putative ATP-dependent endonuclease of OLD family
LLLNPSNAAAVSESDYWKRDSTQEFVIEAVMTLPEATGISSQHNFSWPWAWNGQDAVAPPASEDDDLPAPDDPVYRVRVRGTTELELAWEIVQPHDDADHFSVGVRRKIGLVRLSADERNDRDLRLVYGSALDRLLADNALRARIGKQVSDLNLHDSLNEQGKEAIKNLDSRMVEAALPRDLKLGLTTSQGLSIGALIGLLATKNGISLPLASWGAGTRRMTALEIASSTKKEASVTIIDEIERGLEPYRLRKLINVLQEQHGQTFLTTHSPVAITCADQAHLWYLDSKGNIGALPHEKIGPQQRRDPETFLARVAVIAEGPTEVGFLQFLLEKAFGTEPLDYGVRVCDGQGNPATLDLLETLASAGLLFAGFADDEGTAPGRWKALKDMLGARLHQWPQGCTEQHVIGAVPDEKLQALLRVGDGEMDGDRLRTLADRLGLQDKQPAAIEQTLAATGKTWRALIIDAATGSKTGAPEGAEKSWKSHSRHWFKSEAGGRELAEKMVALGAWDTVQPQLLPLINAILASAGRPALVKLDL